MIIKYPAKGNETDERMKYRLELIHLALEATRKEFGDYEIQPYINTDPGVKRQALLFESGAYFNLVWASPGSALTQFGATPINIDILHGQAGNRICLINKNNPLPVKNINNIAFLHNIRIGQGLGWSDAEIYASNKIDLVSSSDVEGLYAMLATKRFDCLPLGADEIDTIYHEKKQKMPMLAIDDNLLIHYDFPIYFYIHANYPRIAERLKKGMALLQDNGEFDRLFARYYQEKITTLHLRNRKVICLKSPYLPDINQCL